MLQEFINALEDGTQCDFIAQHYWEMDNSDLKRIILELLYAVDRYAHEDVIEYVEEELKDWVE